MKKISTFIFFTAIILSQVFAQAPPTAPYTIYLSFDDGPLQGSGNIAQAITNENIKINVFVVGQHIAGNNERKKDFEEYIENPLIEVGNHSYSHAHNRYQQFYSNADSVVLDFKKCYFLFKLPTKLCRLPGRNMWRIPNKRVNDVLSGADAADILSRDGFRVIGWDLEWQHDGKTGAPIQTVDDMVYMIENKLRKKSTLTDNHLVLLLHDEMFRKGWEESELKKLIEKLRGKPGYQFEHLSKYPGL